MTEESAEGVRGHLLYMHGDSPADGHFVFRRYEYPPEVRMAAIRVLAESVRRHLESPDEPGASAAVADAMSRRDRVFAHKDYWLACEDIEVELLSDYNALFDDGQGNRRVDYASRVTGKPGSEATDGS